MSIRSTNSAAGLVGRIAGPDIAGWLGVLALPALTIAVSSPASTSESAAAGRSVYEKANCIGCHKWHGGGGGGYGGVALSLRETMLGYEQIMEVVRCGRPGTRMPYHARGAYDDVPCYGMSRVEVGDAMPPPAPRSLTESEIAAVAAYVEVAIKGKGEPTQEDCISFWGADARQCASLR